jgi:hypothetical protein
LLRAGSRTRSPACRCRACAAGERGEARPRVGSVCAEAGPMACMHRPSCRLRAGGAVPGCGG